jgi:hypothetical protein
MFFFQETHRVDSETPMWPMYDEYSETVPEGIRDKECKWFALQECPPVLYVPETDPVQERVSALKSDQSLKTKIKEDAGLCLLIWHCEMREAFLMHVSTATNTIKKQGTFAHAEAHELYMEHCKVVKQAKATLAVLNAATCKGEKTSKKASQRTKKGAALADTPDPELCVEYQTELEKAKFAAETAKNKKESSAKEMFQFYAKLLFADAEYAWNKIVKEQMESDPFKDLQGMPRKGPRVLLREPFDDCMMFHLLTVSPNNAAEQEKSYLSNLLKKPQQVGVCQFVQRVEQLKAYIAQLPCWYYSPSYNPSMTLANVSFTKADLVSHVLRMCPHGCQD